MRSGVPLPKAAPTAFPQPSQRDGSSDHTIVTILSHLCASFKTGSGEFSKIWMPFSCHFAQIFHRPPLFFCTCTVQNQHFSAPISAKYAQNRANPRCKIPEKRAAAGFPAAARLCAGQGCVPCACPSAAFGPASAPRTCACSTRSTKPISSPGGISTSPSRQSSISPTSAPT